MEPTRTWKESRDSDKDTKLDRIECLVRADGVVADPVPLDEVEDVVDLFEEQPLPVFPA